MKSEWEWAFGSSGDAEPCSGRVTGTRSGARGTSAAVAERAGPDEQGSRLADLVAAAARSAPACGTPQDPVGKSANGALAAELTALHGGHGDPDALVDAFRESVVLIPTVEGGLRAATSGGVRWLFAFSGGAELARFAAAAGSARGSAGGGAAIAAGGGRKEDVDVDVDYVTVHGWRLLDEVVPAVGAPAGVALDVAGRLPMLFPPATGVVPDSAAVDAEVLSGEIP
ncbi:hypothetical protein [Streptomyces sp. NPDC021020]|uniref:hypothetical protein n=1 Tax=Streptomyces sp. NPDC021020 TaxID=3365109 RepID=UPI0037B5B7BD